MQLRTLLLAACVALLAKAANADSFTDPAAGGSHVVVSDDPALHLVNRGVDFTGVGFISIEYLDGTFGFCSGSLLVGGTHVLTAAHPFIGAKSVTAIFRTGFSTFDIIPLAVPILHPSYVGAAFFDPFDIAILELPRAVDAVVERYAVYTARDELGRVFTRVGYGATGVGVNQFTDLFERFGQNRWESYSEPFFGHAAGESILMYDFDNGDPLYDGFGTFFGLPDLGLGSAEVGAAPGDSGGPTFLDGLIAGVHSFGVTTFPVLSPPDFTAFFDNSWGEFGGDTRVSSFTAFIAQYSPGATTPVPEPGTLLLFAVGALAAWGCWRRTPSAERGERHGRALRRERIPPP